jgi:hypothetical protein
MKNLVKVVLLLFVITFSLTVYGCSDNSAPSKTSGLSVTDGPSEAAVKNIIGDQLKSEDRTPYLIEVLEKEKRMENDSWPVRVRIQAKYPPSAGKDKCQTFQEIYYFYKGVMGDYDWTIGGTGEIVDEGDKCKDI